MKKTSTISSFATISLIPLAVFLIPLSAHATLTRTTHSNTLTIVTSGQPITMTTASFTPSNNSLIVVAFGIVNDSTGDVRTGSDVSGGGLTWTQQLVNGDILPGYNYTTTHEIWTAPVTTGASMTVTVANAHNSGGDPARMEVQIVSYASVSASPVGATVQAVDQGTAAVTLTLSASTANTSTTFASRYVVENNTANTTATPSTGWSEIYETATPANGYGDLQSMDRTASTSDKVIWSDFADNAASSLFTSSGMAIEIKEGAAVAASSVTRTMRLFEGFKIKLMSGRIIIHQKQ